MPRVDDIFNDNALNVRPMAVTPVERSTTIATGGTAQQLVGANGVRRSLLILNPPSATETLWVYETGTAAANGEATGSIALLPGQSIKWDGLVVTTGAVSVVAATTGHKVTAKEM